MAKYLEKPAILKMYKKPLAKARGYYFI